MSAPGVDRGQEERSGDIAPLVIGDAAPEELAQLSRLTEAAYEEYSRIMEPAAWQGLRAAVSQGLSPATIGDRIVARVGNRIVGSVILCPPAVETYGGAVQALPWPEVRLLAVAPDGRGRGTARALMNECVRRARSAGHLKLGLHTSRSMTAARRLYRAMGFTRAPQYDFQPPGGELVEAYTLDLR